MKTVALVLLAAIACASRAGAAQPQATPTPVTTVEAGSSSEHLTNNHGSWQSVYVTASHEFQPRRVVYAGFTTDRRFGFTDETYTGGFYVPPSTNTILNVELSVSPTHFVLPRNDLLVSLEHRLAGGWGYTLGAQHRSYTAAEVQSGSVLIDRYSHSFRFGYAINATRLSNVSGTSLSQTALLSHYYGLDQRSSTTLTVNAGREVESVGNAVLVSAVTGASLNGMHWFAPNLGAAWALYTSRQGALYNRSGILLGLRARL